MKNRLKKKKKKQEDEYGTSVNRIFLLIETSPKIPAKSRCLVRFKLALRWPCLSVLVIIPSPSSAAATMSLSLIKLSILLRVAGSI